LLDLVAKKLFLTKGVGVADDKLTSFEFALRQAGIAGTNIVLISSIFPPYARLISRKDGLKLIKPGQILFSIYSRNQTNEPNRLVSASVGIAQPKDRSKYGYLSEYDTFGKILQVTAIAVADELCSASELVMGKVENCPVAIIRNFKFDFSDAKIQKIIRPKAEDLFR